MRPLGKPLYGDFLRYHQQLGGAPWGVERLHRLYKALDGNFKGSGVFPRLEPKWPGMTRRFSNNWSTQKKLQLHMMVEKLVDYLQPDERELLNRLRAYLAPTFADGVRVVAQGFGRAGAVVAAAGWAVAGGCGDGTNIGLAALSAVGGGGGLAASA